MLQRRKQMWESSIELLSIKHQINFNTESNKTMHFLILGDLFSGLKPWLLDSQEPVGMPAVYNFYKYLGISDEHKFKAYIITKTQDKVVFFPNGSQIFLRKLPINNHIVFRLASYFFMLYLAIKEAKQRKYNVVYGMANYSLCASFVGWLYNLPVVNRVFGTLATGHLQSGQMVKVYARHLLEFITAKFSRGILISTNDGTQYDEFVKFSKRKNPFFHLYNGIDNQFKASLLKIENALEFFPKNEVKIYSIGRLTNWKRHDQAIDVVFKLRQKSQIDYKLTILGDGPDLQSLQKKIDSLNLNDSIKIIKSVPQKQYIELLKSADVCLFCYDHSNLGNALWESALAGRLIAAKNTGDTGKVLRDNVNSIVVADDEYFSDVMASRILKATSSKDDNMVSLVESSRKDISNLIPSWEVRIQNEISIIENGARNIR